MLSFSLVPPVFPILYSFRRCPYAMRARLAILAAERLVELREVALKNKPAELLQVSPKATVPVLVLPDGRVIDESRDIMLWALSQHDPHRWLVDDGEVQAQTIRLIDLNDFQFKPHLDAYKYADRHPQPADTYRQHGEAFLQRLEQCLTEHRYLISDQISFADMAIFPFIRQFAHVDKNWFDHSDYKKLQEWLNELLVTDSFINVMHKYPAWQSGDVVRVFP